MIRPDRRQAPPELREEFEAAIESVRLGRQVDEHTARRDVRSAVGLALRCGRPFDFATWLRENVLVEQ